MQLAQLTATWRRVSQEVLMAMVEHAGSTMSTRPTLRQLVDSLSVPHDMVAFDAETDSFA